MATAPWIKRLSCEPQLKRAPHAAADVIFTQKFSVEALHNSMNYRSLVQKESSAIVIKWESPQFSKSLNRR